MHLKMVTCEVSLCLADQKSDSQQGDTLPLFVCACFCMSHKDTSHRCLLVTCVLSFTGKQKLFKQPWVLL